MKTKLNSKKIYLLLRLVFVINFFYSYLYASEFDVFLKHEKDEFYSDALKDKNFTAQRKFESGENLIESFSKKGGSHLGVLYLIIENKQHKLRHYRLDIGPVYDIITPHTLSYLSEDQFLVISTTGGTGQHHVFACLINIEKDDLKVQSIIPLYGHSVPAGTNCAFKYQIKRHNYDKDKKVMTLTYDSFFDNPTLEDMNTIKNYLKFKSLNTIFDVIVMEGSPSTLKASESIKKTLEMDICGQHFEVLKLNP